MPNEKALLRNSQDLAARGIFFRGLFWTLAASVLFWDPTLTYTLPSLNTRKHQYTFLIFPADNLINDAIYLSLNLLATNIVPPTQTAKPSASSLHSEEKQE